MFLFSTVSDLSFRKNSKLPHLPPQFGLFSKSCLSELNTMIETPISSTSTPIYKPFPSISRISAAYTGRGPSPSNRHFSFHRPPVSDPTHIQKHFTANLRHLSQHEGFDSRRLTLPNGPWPQSGAVIKAEDYEWVINPRSQTIMPVTAAGQPVVYDGIVTRETRFVLGVQGADCPAVFLYDPKANVIGLAHSGWKPIVRGIIQGVIDIMVELGARPEDIVAYVSPGAGDEYNVFKWDEEMELEVRDVFVQANRTDLLHDQSIRHEMTGENLARLGTAIGRPVLGGTSFRLSFLAGRELEACGVSPSNITRSLESTIVTLDGKPTSKNPAPFKYHSYRRERPNHGLSMSVLFLRSEGMSQL
jgi:copper oxidase (laccase) domain-containing protein